MNNGTRVHIYIHVLYILLECALVRHISVDVGDSTAVTFLVNMFSNGKEIIFENMFVAQCVPLYYCRPCSLGSWTSAPSVWKSMNTLR